MNWADPLQRRLLAPLFALVCAMLLCGPVSAQANRSLDEHRVALIIGNAAYKTAPLRNPVNDARAMRDKLRGMGFQVIHYENLQVRQVGSALREFRNAIRPGSVALFFYAGHGLQVRGDNFLPTVDAELASEEDVPQQSLSVASVLNTMEDSKAAVNLVLLDACRNNPFARNFRSSPTGLARVQAPSGTLIHYATRPGSVADDGAGRHGMYTEALLAQIGDKGVPIETALKRVTIRVRDASKGKQEPWMEGSLTGDFYFVVSPGATLNVQSTPAPTNADEAAWQAAESVRSAAAYRVYLAEFPQGLYAAAARIKLAGLAPAPAAATAVPATKAAAPPKAGTPTLAAPAVVALPAAPLPKVALAPTLPPKTSTAAAQTEAEAQAEQQREQFRYYALREMSLARIYGSAFQMGADADEAGADGQPDASAQPKHGVTVPNFELAYYEVQVGQWKKFAEATRYLTEAENPARPGCHVPARGGGWELKAGVNWRTPGYEQTDYHPVVCISFNDVTAYLQWLNAGVTSGPPYRLPSEAEWEFAARGGTTSIRPWSESAGFFGRMWEGVRGSNAKPDQPPSRSCRYANVADEALAKQIDWPGAFNCRDSYPFATGGGWFGRDNLSLYDMLGNAAEWVQDCWHPNHEGAPADGSPRSGGDCTRRTVRGGSWASPQSQVRSAARLAQPLSYRASDLGFRLARNPP